MHDCHEKTDAFVTDAAAAPSFCYDTQSLRRMAISESIEHASTVLTASNVKLRCAVCPLTVAHDRGGATAASGGGRAGRGEHGTPDASP